LRAANRSWLAAELRARPLDFTEGPVQLIEGPESAIVALHRQEVDILSEAIMYARFEQERKQA